MKVSADEDTNQTRSDRTISALILSAWAAAASSFSYDLSVYPLPASSNYPAFISSSIWLIFSPTHFMSHLYGIIILVNLGDFKFLKVKTPVKGLFD